MEHRLWGGQASVVAACGVSSTGSIVGAHRLSCSVARGIFPDQGSNLCPLHVGDILIHCATRKVHPGCFDTYRGEERGTQPILPA